MPHTVYVYTVIPNQNSENSVSTVLHTHINNTMSQILLPIPLYYTRDINQDATPLFFDYVIKYRGKEIKTQKRAAQDNKTN